MNNQNKIIVFCYAYVVGLVLSMVAPLDASLLTVMRMATGLAFFGTAVYFLRSYVHREGIPVRRSLAFECLIIALPALSLGFTRYTSSNTVPDTKLAELQITNGQAHLRFTKPIPDYCRLRVRKTQPIESDILFRITGPLDARIPLTGADGAARMDEQGRWLFRISRVTLTSEVVTVRADDPLGTEVLIDQPFSRITGLEIVQSPTNAAVELYRVSNHISSFARPGRNHAALTILGRITQDPRVYDFKTILPVTPDYIQYPPGGPFYRVAGGDVEVALKPEMENYARFARTGAYGCSVQVRGELSVARAAANPGGFDPRRFMQNHNVYGVMSVFQPPGAPPPARIIVPEGGAVRRGSGIVRFSLDLRDRMLRVFKLTMPYPQSAFLGGVTLGLRYGLQNVVCLLNRSYGGGAETDDGSPRDDCEEFINDEFKEAGVNHVLAVSGLHVTIITIMFIGIFSLMRMPRQAFVPFIVLALIVFAIITGARPSVLRAVIMHCLFLLTWGYLDQGLRSSVLLGVPVAAFLILLQNPLVVVDPSFTLSFGAILSLALLTTPFVDLLSRLRGYSFLAFLLITTLTTGIGMLCWPLLVTPAFLLVYAVFCAGLTLILRHMEGKGIRPIGRLGYVDIPPVVGTFLAAQCAIQIGMMVPLSAYYFSRWPFAGAYANLIAIPLIGVVVQLGALAGLLGLIPVVGVSIALVLNAANWVFSSAFILLAHYFSALFPYPFVRRPSIRFLVVYYIFCGALIWFRPIWSWFGRVGERLRPGGGPWTRWTLLGLSVVLATTPLWLGSRRDPPPGLQVTVLSLGYASSALVESPGGKTILIDCGFVEHVRGRNKDAIRTILPFLAHNGIRHLDAVILTSPHIERTAGAGYLIEQAWVDRLCVPPTMAKLSPGTAPAEFYSALAAGHDVSSYNPGFLQGMYDEIIGNPARRNRLSLARVLARRGPTWINKVAGQEVAVLAVRDGDVLYREGAGPTEFRVEILNPGIDIPQEQSIENGSVVVRVVYGRFAMLFCGDLQYAGQADLARRAGPHRLQADVILMPHHGNGVPAGSRADLKKGVLQALEAGTRPLLDAAKPETVIFDYGNPRGVLGMASRNAESVHELTVDFVRDQMGDGGRILSTDKDLAVIIRSDGGEYTIETQAERNRAPGTGEDIVEDIDVGL